MWVIYELNNTCANLTQTCLHDELCRALSSYVAEQLYLLTSQDTRTQRYARVKCINSLRKTKLRARFWRCFLRPEPFVNLTPFFHDMSLFSSQTPALTFVVQLLVIPAVLIKHGQKVEIKEHLHIHTMFYSVYSI